MAVALGKPCKMTIKKTVNVRLHADIIEWLQSAGKGYQTRMNTILREAMSV